MSRVQSRKIIGVVGLLALGVALRAAAQDAAATSQNAGVQPAAQNVATQNTPAQNAPAAMTAPLKSNSEIMVVLGTATPEPGSMALVGLGALLIGWRWKKARG